MAGQQTSEMPSTTNRCGHREIALSAAMPGRSVRTTKSDSLIGEVSARLSLFEDLPPDALQRLTAMGFGRGFLTVSLRARLRKAGYRDFGHLTQTSPEAIARIRKFGPVRVERIRDSILDELARWLPGAREVHTAEATRERRLEQMRDMPVEHLPCPVGAIAALGLAGRSCADVANRSRLELLDTGFLMSSDVDRIITKLAGILNEGKPIAPLSVEVTTDALKSETEAVAARRAALLAQQDREWEEVAPIGNRRRSDTSRTA